jgi:hypothetical protein
VTLASIRAQVGHIRRRLEARQTGERARALLDQLRDDPGAVLALGGTAPDPWQRDCLASNAARMLLCCSRQAGKSTAAAAIAVRTALLEASSLVLLLSPTLRQSGELFRSGVLPIWRRLGCPLGDKEPTALELRLANGSRVVSLPENESGVRGFAGVALLVIDEASRVSDDLYRAVRPMLAVSRGRLLALSSPFGKRGWFYDSWRSDEAWQRVKVTATECPRISAQFLQEERQALGERWYRQEYECSFEETLGAVFSAADIAAMFDDPTVLPLFPQGGGLSAAAPASMLDDDVRPLFARG